MRKSLIILTCIGKGALKAFGGGVIVDILKISEDVWKELGKESKEAQRIAEIQQIAQASAEAMREMVRETVREIAPERPQESRQQLEDYLFSVQSQVRRSLRRPSDSGGTTIPPGLRLGKAEDLAALIPPRLPRFKPGDRPLPGVDLEIVELLGIGGFGEVWRARNPRMHSQEEVALKFCVDESASESLRREAALLDRVMSEGQGHPGLVQLKRTYLSANPPCLEYELVAGGDLGGLIQSWHHEHGGVTPSKAAGIILRIARIVGFAHQLAPPIVHRDLKPSNILVVSRDENKIDFKVADFGIGGIATEEAAKARLVLSATDESLTAAHHGSYTPLYASPEQMRGENPDPRDDVHALGVIWHHLLTGNLSEGAPTGGGWKRNLAAMNMDDRLIGLLESCIEGRAQDRPASANHLFATLDTLIHPAAVTPVAEPRQAPQPIRVVLPTPPAAAASKTPFSNYDDVPWFRRTMPMVVANVINLCGFFPVGYAIIYIAFSGDIYINLRNSQGELERWPFALKLATLVVPVIQAGYLIGIAARRRSCRFPLIRPRPRSPWLPGFFFARGRAQPPPAHPMGGDAASAPATRASAATP